MSGSPLRQSPHTRGRPVSHAETHNHRAASGRVKYASWQRSPVACCAAARCTNTPDQPAVACRDQQATGSATLLFLMRNRTSPRCAAIPEGGIAKVDGVYPANARGEVNRQPSNTTTEVDSGDVGNRTARIPFIETKDAVGVALAFRHEPGQIVARQLPIPLLLRED